MIDSFCVRTRDPLRRKLFQRGLEIAAPIGREGAVQHRLLVGRPFEFVGVKNGGIIKAPLDQVIGGAHEDRLRRHSRFDRSRLAGLEIKRPKLGLKPDIAFDHTQDPGSILSRFEMEFRSANGGHGRPTT